MPCDSKLKPRQTIQQRADEVRRAVGKVQARLITGRASVTINKQGAVAFGGIPDDERDGVTDACIYRRIMSTGSGLAKATIARAEALAGRAVNRKTIAAGVHSHDGGKTWHNGH